MFRQFLRSSFRDIQRKTRISSTALTAVGVSGSLLYLTAGRNSPTKVIRCDSGSNLDDDELGLESGSVTGFKRPRWKEEDYLSADRILSSGPTWFPSPKSGVVRCDALIINANAESEDSIAVYFPESNEPDDRRTFLALFDGHNGPAMSDFLCDNLLEYVANALSKLPQQYDSSSEFFGSDHSQLQDDSEDLISSTIKQAFKQVDDAMLDVTDVLASPSKTNAIRTLRHADSGSCALMSVYDIDTKLLRVALTGDSRAVLGRKVVSESKSSENPSTTYYSVHSLSSDQNGYNPSEVARIEAEHPGENIIKDGRVIGWGISRAFGNGPYKWSLDIQKQLYERYLGRSVRSNVKTPPYLTAEPEITTTRVRKGDFLIMASDGLWDCITSEEAVGLVGIWLENNWDAVYGTNIPQRTNQPQLQLQSQPKTRTLNTTLTTSIPKVYEPHELPLESLRLKSNSSKDSKTGGNDRAQNYAYWRAQKRFVLNRDDSSSVAGHLARNALGGADRDLTEALLSFDVGGGRARKYRDDIAILVAFFN